jgi:hypothetical protein
MICKLTNTIYKQFSGELPAATMRGLAIIQDDEVMAVCGVSFIASEYFITLGVKPGVNKRDIITGWAEFTNMLDDKKMYFALVDRDIAKPLQACLSTLIFTMSMMTFMYMGVNNGIYGWSFTLHKRSGEHWQRVRPG